VGEDGTFRIEGVAPDRYRIGMNPSANLYVKSIDAAGRDARYQPVDIAGGVEVLITLSTRVGKLSGNVEKAKPEMAPGVVVVENAEDPGGNVRLSLTFPVGQDGKFQSSSISPGEYRVYAFEDVEMMAAGDREFLKKFASRAATVKIGERETKTVTLKQIPASEVDEALKN
jgi:hypothetical protein